jgi:hypothetical protein
MLHARKPRTLQFLRHKIEIACIAVPPATVEEVYHSVAPVFSTMHWGWWWI